MKQEDIRKMLREIEVPEPDETAKKAAIAAAVAEFKKQTQEMQVKREQILCQPRKRSMEKWLPRIDKIGESILSRPFLVTSGATACVVIVVFGISMYSNIHQMGLPNYIAPDESMSPRIVVSENQVETLESPDPVTTSKRVGLETVTDKPAPITTGQGEEAEPVSRKKTVSQPSADKPKEPKPKPVRPPKAMIAQNDPKSKTEQSVATNPIVAPVPQSTGDVATVLPKQKKPLLVRPSPTVPLLGRSVPRLKEKSGSAKFVFSNGKAPGKTDRKGFLNQTTIATGPSFSSKPSDTMVVQPQEDIGRDQFEKIDANPVKSTANEPVSTFSVDVDTAGYAFVRKMLNKGALPRKDAVRTEELINYFDYNYAMPDNKQQPFKPTIAVYPTPWNSDTKLLHIGIKGYDIVPEKKPRANLVFLIDVSGSMKHQDKLPLLKNSFRMMVDALDKEDVVSIVVYAGASGTVLEPTKVKEKAKIMEALDRLQAGGSTAGGAGIRAAYALAEANFDKNGVNRVILATDGDFNVGIRHSQTLKNFVERKRKTGVFLSVLGFGQGNYNDALMQKLAQNGNGNAIYIDNLNEARKTMVDEAFSTLFTIAKDVKIQIEFNPNMVAEYRLIGYETRLLNRSDFNNDKVDAGDIGSGHCVTAIYEITPPESKAKLIDDLRYGTADAGAKKKSSFNREYAFLKIRYKLPDSNKSILMTSPVTVDLEYQLLKEVPGEIRFASAVAAYGQLLRGESYMKDYTYDDVIKLASPALGQDSFGYRNEFMNLVRLAKSARSMLTQ